MLASKLFLKKYARAYLSVVQLWIFRMTRSIVRCLGVSAFRFSACSLGDVAVSYGPSYRSPLVSQDQQTTIKRFCLSPFTAIQGRGRKLVACLTSRTRARRLWINEPTLRWRRERQYRACETIAGGMRSHHSVALAKMVFRENTRKLFGRENVRETDVNRD